MAVPVTEQSKLCSLQIFVSLRELRWELWVHAVLIIVFAGPRRLDEYKQDVAAIAHLHCFVTREVLKRNIFKSVIMMAHSSPICEPARAPTACKMAVLLPASRIKLCSLRVARSGQLLPPIRLSRCFSGEGEVNRQAVEGEKTATGAQKVIPIPRSWLACI